MALALQTGISQIAGSQRIDITIAIMNLHDVGMTCCARGVTSAAVLEVRAVWT